METILIVDDERDLRDALKTALSEAKYKVLEAEDGEKGLELARSENPDLILLDITMPHMNGHQVLRELRAHPSGKNPKIILFTNSDDPADITRGVGLKSDAYLIKSQTSLEDIIKKIKQEILGYTD